MRARDRRDIDRSCVDVGLQRDASEDFGEPAFDEPPIEIELEEPIATLNVPFGEEQVAFVACADVRHESTVAHDRDGCRDAGSHEATCRFVVAACNAEHDVGCEPDRKHDEWHDREAGEYRDASHERFTAKAATLRSH
ncbi:MAG: hypothetical protein NVSMB59_07580 [Vulcanimicrobiaceae bacterium]